MTTIRDCPVEERVRDHPYPLPKHLTRDDDWRPTTGWGVVGGVIKRHWFLSALAGFLAVASQSIRYAPPFFLGKAVQDGIIGKDPRALTFWCVLICATLAIVYVLGIFRHIIMVRQRDVSSVDIARALVRRIQQAGAAVSHRVTIGEVGAIATTDIRRVVVVLTAIFTGGGSLISFAVGVASMAYISPILGVIPGVILPAVLWATWLVGRALARRELHARKQLGVVTSRALDTIAGLPVLLGVGGRKSFLTAYERDAQELEKRRRSAHTVYSAMQSLTEIAPLLILGVTAWWGAHLAVNGHIDLAGAIAAVGVVNAAREPARFLFTSIPRFIEGKVAADRVAALCVIDPDVPDTGTTRLPRVTEELHDDLTGATVEPGILTVIVSRDPAHAVAAMSRLARHADAGACHGTTPLSDYQLADVRARIMLSRSDSYLPGGTVRSIIDAGTTAANAGSDSPAQLTDVAVWRALDAAAARDVIEAFDDGLDAELTTGATNVSGGQRQRIRLARALARDCDVLFLEEPTSALDSSTEARVTTRVKEFRAGQTTVVASTSPLWLHAADRVIYLQDDVAHHANTHRDLLTADDDYRSVVEGTHTS